MPYKYPTAFHKMCASDIELAPKKREKNRANSTEAKERKKRKYRKEQKQKLDETGTKKRGWKKGNVKQ